MDYNGGNAPPPRNGEQQPRGNGGGQGNGRIREWQRETWFGPAPDYDNPFDEPEDAPELRDSRSENVNEHLGEFWEQQTTGYQYTGVNKTGGKKEESGKRKGGKKTGILRMVLIPVCLLAAAALILRFTIFNLQDIRVEGNQSLTDAEILQISGIHAGDSLLLLDEAEVERRVNGDYRLQFRYLEKKVPGQATLRVREREACCWFTYGGILYTMDKNRMVLYESEDLNLRPAELVEVKGLKIRSGCRVGQTLTLNDKSQETLISGLFLEMKVLGCTRLIQEADLSNPASLLMMTRDGYTVTMGDMTNLHAKLRAVLLVQDKLRDMELSGGNISVINPESPVYSPPAV